MSGLFEIDALAKRLRAYVERSDTLKPEALRLLRKRSFAANSSGARSHGSRDCPSGARGVC